MHEFFCFREKLVCGLIWLNAARQTQQLPAESVIRTTSLRSIEVHTAAIGKTSICTVFPSVMTLASSSCLRSTRELRLPLADGWKWCAMRFNRCWSSINKCSALVQSAGRVHWLDTRSCLCVLFLARLGNKKLLRVAFDLLGAFLISFVPDGWTSFPRSCFYLHVYFSFLCSSVLPVYPLHAQKNLFQTYNKNKNPSP